MNLKKLTLLYVLPSNVEHAGIRRKVYGQIEAMEKNYRVRLVAIRYGRQDSVFKKIMATSLFHIKALFLSLFYSTLYVRYNPKVPLLMLFLGCLSFFKPIYVEYNVIYINELTFLKRYAECLLHKAVMSFVSRMRFLHVSVNHELMRHLNKTYHLDESRHFYCQNGINPPLNPIRDDLIQEISKFKQEGKKLGIFLGNGYPWHGLSMVLSLLESEPTAQLLVVGPYPVSSHKNVKYIGNISPEQLVAVMDECDFGVSTFRWDMLGITEGSPLKTRDYLGRGLPILTNYYDCAEDYEELQPYVFNYHTDKDSFKKLLAASFDKEKISAVSRNVLSWNAIWKLNGILPFKKS